MKPLKPGDIIKDLDGTKCHVVGIVNDGDRIIYVFKWYGKHQQWWHYKTILHDHIEFLNKQSPVIGPRIIRKRKTETI